MHGGRARGWLAGEAEGGQFRGGWQGFMNGWDPQEIHKGSFWKILECIFL